MGDNDDLDPLLPQNEVARRIPSDLARRVWSDLSQLRRDLDRRFERIEDEINHKIDAFGQRMAVNVRWGVGLMVLVLLAVAGAYFASSRTLEHVMVRQDTVLEKNLQQDDTMKLFDQRLRAIEMSHPK